MIPRSPELMVLFPSRKGELGNWTMHLVSPGLNWFCVCRHGMEETKAEAHAENFTEEESVTVNCPSASQTSQSQTFHLGPPGSAKLGTALVKCKCQPAASHSVSALTSESPCPLTYRDAASHN